MSKIYQKITPRGKNRSEGVLGRFIHDVILRSFYSESHPFSIKRAGFTLIELLVVVLIAGILAAVALPQYEKAVMNARFAQVVTAGESIYKAAELYYMAQGKWPTSLYALSITMPGAVFSGNIVQGNNFSCYLAAGQENLAHMAPSVQCYVLDGNRDGNYGWRRFFDAHEGKRYCYALASSDRVNAFCQTIGEYKFANNSHNYYELY